MVGEGLNEKSMAYVGNVAAFIDYCMKNLSGYQLFNYVDKPDLNMVELVSQVEQSLNRKVPSTRLPYWIGMIGGYVFDLLSFVFGISYSISSVRVKKFCSTTQFDAKKTHSSGFKAPHTLAEGLKGTLKNEFK